MTTAVISMTVTPGILFARHIDIPIMTVCDAFIIEFMACIISIGVCLIFFMLNTEKDSQTAQMLAVFMCFCIVAVLPLWTEFEAFGLAQCRCRAGRDPGGSHRLHIRLSVRVRTTVPQHAGPHVHGIGIIPESPRVP